MKTLILIIVITIIFLTATGCVKDPSIERLGMVQIENSIITDTLLIYETATAAIKASATNGCWSNLFVEFKRADTYTYSIKAFGVFESGGACPAVMVYHDTIIDFQLYEKGTYIFRIQKNPNNFITDTLIVI
jgi:hypothetical protein